MTLSIRVGALTDVGRVRTINQDAFLVLEDLGLYAVADGMGGHRGGEVASQIAIEALRAAYVDRAPDALTEAIAEANGRIFDAGAGDPNLHGMGTTVVAAAVLADGEGGDGAGGGQVLVANVGDSRAYLFRDGDLTQLTEDHSMVADLLREGRITEEEAEVHPQRNIVTRVLGVYDQVDVDLWPIDAVAGDRVVLCSDGLFNEVTLDQITSVLRRLDDPQEVASELVRRANEGGGRDNITVVVLDVVDDGGVAKAASAALATETRRPATASSDMAGFGSALDEDADSDASATDDGGWRARRKQRKEDAEPRSLRSRLTWRTIAFIVAVVVVIGGAVVTIQWYGTSTYFVRFDGDEVVIFKGRPDGVLWIDPEVVDRTAIDRDEVPERFRDALEAGSEQSSLTRAERYVSNIEDAIIEAERRAAATSTTTTTIPAVPSAATVPP